MKPYLSWILFAAAVSPILASTSAHAFGGGRNRGIDGTLSVNGSPVYVTDRDHNRRELVPGNYNVKPSNRDHNITFTFNQDDANQIVISVPQFQGDQDLGNFYLPGSSIGQDLDLQGSTQEFTTQNGSRIESETCYEGDWYGTQQVRIDSTVTTKNFTIYFGSNGQAQAQFNAVLSSNESGASRIYLSGCQLIGRRPSEPVYIPSPVFPGGPHEPGEPNPPAHEVPTPGGGGGHVPGEPNPPAHPVHG